MEISNRTLALFLFISVLITLIGNAITWNKLESTTITGKVTATGTANITITNTEAIIFRIDSVDLGAGYVNTSAGGNNCTLIVNGTNESFKSIYCAGFANSAPDPFIIENDGNREVSVQLYTDKNASEFIGGGVGSIVDPEFNYLIQNNETSSCALTPSPTTFTDFNTTTPGTTICSNLSFVDSRDSLRVAIRLLIPYDATGTKNATLYATGTGI